MVTTVECKVYLKNKWPMNVIPLMDTGPGSKTDERKTNTSLMTYPSGTRMPEPLQLASLHAKHKRFLSKLLRFKFKLSHKLPTCMLFVISVRI